MDRRGRLLVLKLLPVLLAILAAASWFAVVEESGPYLVGNLVPLLVLLLLAFLTLYRGGGKWSGAGMRMPLGTLGFAVPALGLSLYLHFAYAVNLNDMFSESRFPERVFRYLPVYTLVAGGIGFAIGWIVGRNV